MITDQMLFHKNTTTAFAPSLGPPVAIRRPERKVCVKDGVCGRRERGIPHAATCAAAHPHTNTAVHLDTNAAANTAARTDTSNTVHPETSAATHPAAKALGNADASITAHPSAAAHTF